jgi:hypothetical protein
MALLYIKSMPTKMSPPHRVNPIHKEETSQENTYYLHPI